MPGFCDTCEDKGPLCEKIALAKASPDTRISDAGLLAEKLIDMGHCATGGEVRIGIGGPDDYSERYRIFRCGHTGQFAASFLIDIVNAAVENEESVHAAG